SPRKRRSRTRSPGGPSDEGNVHHGGGERARGSLRTCPKGTRRGSRTRDDRCRRGPECAECHRGRGRPLDGRSANVNEPRRNSSTTRRMRFMVVDDDPVVLEVTRERLSFMGYDVIVRESALGTSAAILRERPDVVLLDVNMPSLSGEQLAQ